MSPPTQIDKDLAVAEVSFDFEADDADIVFLSSGETPTIYKLHKRHLGAASPVFSDMLDLGCSDADADPHYCGLPVVQLPDSSEVLDSLLPYCYPNLSRLHDLCALSWAQFVPLWEASMKYGMGLAQALLQEHVRRM